MNQANPFSAPESPSKCEGVGHLLDPPVVFAGEFEPADWFRLSASYRNLALGALLLGFIVIGGGFYRLMLLFPNASPVQLLARMGTVDAFISMFGFQLLVVGGLMVYTAWFLGKSVKYIASYTQSQLHRFTTGAFDGDGLMVLSSESAACYPWKSIILLNANNKHLTVQFNNGTVMPIPNRMFASQRAIDLVVEAGKKLKINAIKGRLLSPAPADGLPPLVDIDEWKRWSIDHWPIQASEVGQQDFVIRRGNATWITRLRSFASIQLLLIPCWAFAITWMLGIFSRNEREDFFPPVFGWAAWVFLVMYSFQMAKLILFTRPQPMGFRLRDGGIHQAAGLEIWNSWSTILNVIQTPKHVGYTLANQPVPTLYSRAQFASDEDFERFGDTLQQFFDAWKASHTN